MKYFLDQEFHEGFHKPFLGRRRHFIDLISIGIVSEDGREFYAISRDFDVDAAWNAFSFKEAGEKAEAGMKKVYYKDYWLRNNVLLPIWYELELVDYRLNVNEHSFEFINMIDEQPKDEQLNFFVKHILANCWNGFSKRRFKSLINQYGQKNYDIAHQVKIFTDTIISKADGHTADLPGQHEFYGYYADYDWVVFCSSLFGKMIELPENYPMYCKDLKQMLDFNFGINQECIDFIKQWNRAEFNKSGNDKSFPSLSDLSDVFHEDDFKRYANFPKQKNEHHALSDARWNKELYDFLK